MTTLIPLRLSTSNNVILWNNTVSQSVRFCRPVQMEYVQESKDIVLWQKNNIEDQIKMLQVIQVKVNGVCTIDIHVSLFLTLIDGKVLNYITDTKSMQTCPICHATPKYFNNLSNKQTDLFLPDTNSLQFGISPLHAWIRIFQCLLHISYRLDTKVWQMRTNEQKAKFSDKKINSSKVLVKNRLNSRQA